MGIRNWTPEQDDKLRQLKAMGQTYKEMAPQLDRTESSLIGRWHYLTRSPEQARGAHEARKIREASGQPASGWTPEEDAELIKLRGGGLQFIQIAPRLSRSIRSVYSRWQWLHLTPAQKEKRRAYKRHSRKTSGRIDQPILVMAIPPEVMNEWQASLKAPKTLTGWLLGDPPYQRSALARKLAEARA